VIELGGIRRDRTRGTGGGQGGFRLEVPAFTVAAGEFVALTGDSGSGKSTLLDLLALVLKPDRMERFRFHPDGAAEPVDIAAAWTRGGDRRLADLRRRYMGYVPQSGGLLPYLTVAGNLRLPLRLNGRPADRTLIAEAAAHLGVAHVLNSKPARLSGGERQRVAILRALMHRPVLVLADEPTAAVDKPRAAAIVADFRALARMAGTAVVMVTHDHDLIAGQADRHYHLSVETAGADWVTAHCLERAA
jgi:putative ABC transport system ATP-binding protein